MNPEEREQQQLHSFFDKRDSKKSGKAKAKNSRADQQTSAMRSIAEDSAGDGLEDAELVLKPKGDGTWLVDLYVDVLGVGLKDREAEVGAP